MMRFDFVHCHGSGNDFPLIDARGMTLAPAEWAVVARALADRTGPVGGDGLLLLADGDADTAFRQVMLNADGSEAETCLNGLRCVARAGFQALGLSEATVRLKASTAFVEQAGEVAPGVYGVRETAGPASLDVAAWPMAGRDRVVDEAIAELGARRYTAVAMPNPHLVAFVDGVDDAELVAVGTLCEAAPDWLPNRANVSFVEVRGGDLFVRTCERGVGLTDSCGSAMAASTYAACLTGRVPWNTEIIVFNRGGLVRATAGEDAMVTLVGNATWEYAGSVDVDLATGSAGGLTIAESFEDEVAAWGRARASATSGGDAVSA